MAILPPPSRTADLIEVVDAPDACSSGAQVELEALLAAMEAMPSNPSVAMRVLWIADDPQTNTPALATTIELDPLLSARLLRIANSSYYSRGNRVTTIARAVVSVGFATVQALAAAAVTGVDEHAPVPTGFWDHAAVVAHASSLVARQFGASANEAFAVGLLHDLGEGVMCRLDPEGWAEIECTESDTRERLDAEREHFGISHAEVAARILHAWHLPDAIVSAVGGHHGPIATGSSLGSAPHHELAETLVCGEAFAEIVRGEDGTRADRARLTLYAAGVTDSFIERVGPRLIEETSALAEVLASWSPRRPPTAPRPRTTRPIPICRCCSTPRRGRCSCATRTAASCRSTRSRPISSAPVSS
jgi:putative nucleotidyltransferase with HDIG domain